MQEAVLLMKGLVLFEDVPDSDLEEIAGHTKILRFEAGQTILEQNIPPGDFYVLCEGSAEVNMGKKGKGNVNLAVYGPGEYFGEMSLLTGENTSAAVVAAEECLVLAIDSEGFSKMLALIPKINQYFVQTLSLRLMMVEMGVWEAHNKEVALTALMKEEKKGKYGDLIGKSKEARSLREGVRKWAASDEPLFLFGEKGTGRELFTRLVHEASARKTRPFFAVNCSQFMEDNPSRGQLFGQFGYLELAAGGTLLLKNADLLGTASLKKLANFISNPMTDLRIILTVKEENINNFTKQELGLDFFEKYLKNKVTFVPLRQRKRDIPELVDYLLNKFAQTYKRPVPDIDKEAMGKLISHDYLQKNITELEEALERAFLIAENDRIESENIFLGIAVGNIGPGINLLRIKPLMAAIQKKIYPGYFQAAVTLAFITNICLNLFGTKDYSQNWGTMLSWSLGWPAFVFCVFFIGRLTCSVCPMSNIASFFQKFFHLAKPIPSFIKKYDYLIITFLFVFILWIEEITNMRQSPRATGILFLSIVSGAVITAVLLPRHSWCRHICPLGGMFGVCSMASPLELRSNAELCLNKCTTHNCFKGTDKTPGCPLFQHVPFIDNNQDCKLCMNCVINCPNGSVQLNLRPPAMEIWDLVRVRRSMVVFVTALIMILFPLAIFNLLHETLTHSQWFIWFTVYYWLSFLAALALIWLLVKNKFNEEKYLPRIRSIYAFIPLVVGAYAAYQVKFLPLMSALILNFDLAMQGAGYTRLIGIPAFDVLVAVLLVFGLLVSLYCAWRITKSGAASKYALAANWVIMLAYFSIVAFMLLRFH